MTRRRALGLALLLGLLLATWAITTTSKVPERLASAARSWRHESPRATPVHLATAAVTTSSGLAHGAFEGRVISSATYQPIPGAQLTFLRDGATSSAVTGANGAFRFVADAPGRHDLQRIEAAGYEPFAPELGYSPIQLVALQGQRLSDLLFYLDPARPAGPTGTGRISGRVLDPDDHPVADALVATEDSSHRPIQVMSDENGAFVLRDLAPGDYELTARATGFGLQRTGLLQVGSEGVELRLQRGARLTIVVRDAQTGAPLPAFSVIVDGYPGGRETFTSFDAKGTLQVELTPGHCDVTAMARGYTETSSRINFGLDMTREEIYDDPPVDHVELRLSRGGRVFGTVTERATRRPVAGVHLEVEGTIDVGKQPIVLEAEGVTDSEGRFSLSGLGPGLHSIHARAKGYDEYTVSRLEVGSGEKRGPVDIDLGKVESGEKPKSEMVGIGVGVATNYVPLEITSVLPAGGAAAAGLRKNDWIMAVDGRSVEELGFRQAIERIRGPAGTTVELSVMTSADTVTVPVVRKRILR